MATKRIQLSIIAMAALLILLAIIQQMAGAAPDAVTLSSFWAESTANNTVIVEFSTSTEFGTDFYLIKRHTAKMTSQAEILALPTITVTFEGAPVVEVPSRGGLSPYTYTVIDEDPTLVPGQTYWYSIIEVEESGGQNPSPEFQDFAVLGTPPQYSIEAAVVNTTGVSLAGSTVTYTVQVTNTGNADSGRYISFRPIVPPTSDGWTANFIPSGAFVLTPMSTTFLTVTVQSPIVLKPTHQHTSTVQITNIEYPTSTVPVEPVTTVGPTYAFPYIPIAAGSTRATDNQ